MRKTCAAPGCGEEFEAKRATAKYHNDRCRKRAQRAPKVGPPEPPIAAVPDEVGGDVIPFEGPLTKVTRVQLERVDRVDTPIGVAALVLAMRLDNPLALAETGSSFAALMREYRAAYAEAMRDAKTERDELDDILGSATVKLLQGGAR